MKVKTISFKNKPLKSFSLILFISAIVSTGTFAGVLVPSANGQPQKEPPSCGLKLLEYFLTGPMAEIDEIIFACRQLNYDRPLILAVAVV